MRYKSHYGEHRWHHPNGKKRKGWERRVKSWLKLNIQKTKIIAYGPITSWQIDEEKVETVANFIFLGFKISADSDCSHEIQRCLLLGRKAMTNLDSIFKSRDTTSLLTKVYQSWGFSRSLVWMCELDHKEGWAPKNRCFWNMVLEKTLETLLDSKRIKPVNPKGNHSLEGLMLMLKLKLQYFGHLMRKN